MRNASEERERRCNHIHELNLIFGFDGVYW